MSPIAIDYNDQANLLVKFSRYMAFRLALPVPFYEKSSCKTARQGCNRCSFVQDREFRLEQRVQVYHYTLPLEPLHAKTLEARTAAARQVKVISWCTCIVGDCIADLTSARKPLHSIMIALGNLSCSRLLW